MVSGYERVCVTVEPAAGQTALFLLAQPHNFGQHDRLQSDKAYQL
jgi:hypothetical protein